MKIGVQIQLENASYSEVEAAARQADLLGIDSVYVWDHVVPLNGSKSLEAWTTLAGIAAVTDLCRLGTLVSPAGFRNPALLAEMALTVQEICKGRLVLGLGAGWYEPDYDALGLDFGTQESRLRDLEEAVPLVAGKLECRVPILIGGGGPTTLRLAAEHASIWHSFSNPGQLKVRGRLMDTFVERSVYMKQEEPLHLADRFKVSGANELVFSLKYPYDLGWVERWLRWRGE